MSSRVTLSRDERASLLREARAADEGARVPIRTSPLKDTERDARFRRDGGPARPGGRGGIHPPARGRPRGSSPRRRWLRRTLLVILALLLIGGGLFSTKVLSVGKNVLNPNRSVFAQLADFLFRGDRLLAGEREGQVNILLLAIGGEGHSGENLADTIMVALLRPEERNVALLSIPRDLYVRVPRSDVYTKINAVHAYRENAKRGEGPLLLAEKVEDITGLDIHYYARVDFDAFKTIVDEIGGVEITNPNSFFDYWHKISFPAGTELMNGERALAYARARYIEGPEGGDFKRAERQQHLLLAIREKLFSLHTAFDLRAVSGILDTLSDHVATSFTLWELKRLAELTRDIPRENIRSTVLSGGPDGLLVGGTELLDGKPAATLRPRAGREEYGEIREFVRNVFENVQITAPPSTVQRPVTPSPTPTPTPPPAPTELPVAAEEPTVEVRNGTTVQGLAARTAAALKKETFTVAAVGNASERGRETTVVVDLTDGKKPNSIQTLLATLGVRTAVQFPASETPSKADFLVLLGTDVEDRFAP